MPRTSKGEKAPAVPPKPKRSESQPLKSDPERVMVLMALVSQGAQAPAVAKACQELGVSDALLQQTIEALEQNARCLRTVREMLAPSDDADEEDED